MSRTWAVYVSIRYDPLHSSTLNWRALALSSIARITSA